MMHARLRIVSLVTLVAALLCSPAMAENWPHWRGPAFNGSSEATNLPVAFGKDKNVAWKVQMPGPSASTPVVWGDKVFVSAGDPQAEKLYAMCIDRNSGKVLWKHEVASGYQKDDRSNYSSPSPVTDGELVVFFYGNGELAAFDLDGKKLWARNLQADIGEFNFLWTFSTSPTIYDGRLYMQVLQRDFKPDRSRPIAEAAPQAGGESYILAIDPKTGKDLWRHIRPTDAKVESREAFTTPIPYEHDGRKVLLVHGGDYMTGHDAATGKELWRSIDHNPQKIGHHRTVPSAVAGAGVILSAEPKKGPLYAYKAGGSGRIEPIWQTQGSELGADVATPAFSDGHFFVLSDATRDDRMVKLVPATGKVVWSTELPGRFKWEASPTVADGKVYCMNFNGDVVVLDATSGKILASNPMGEANADMIRSSIVALDGQLFIRTNGWLYCVGR